MSVSIVSALDIGTTKISCFIAGQEHGSALKVLGMSIKAASGVEHGRITNTAVSQVISACVRATERMAEYTINDLVLSIGGVDPVVKRHERVIKLNGEAVSKDHLDQLTKRSNATLENHVLLHSIHGLVKLDNILIEGSPEGLFGNVLSAQITEIYVKVAPLRNLLNIINGCQLQVRDIVLSSYASGFSTMVAQEREMGSLLIDFGGGLTQACLFYGDSIIDVATLNIGGKHITADIAKGLSTPSQHAERLKNLFGNVLEHASSDMSMVDTPYLGEEHAQEMNRIPKGFIASIIIPRVEEILELLKQRFNPSDFMLIQNIVITGGASQMPGMAQQVQNCFKKPVRLGKPRGYLGLGDATDGPEFATVTGAL
ncbi:MAG: cell division protein FtsA, partial [Pseudomonadota bacterium]